MIHQGKGRRRILLCMALVLFVGMIFFSACAEGNLLVNPEFARPDDLGAPEGWYTDAYRLQTGYSLFDTVTAENGEAMLCITNLADNDARFCQAVQVEP